MSVPGRQATEWRISEAVGVLPVGDALIISCSLQLKPEG